MKVLVLNGCINKNGKTQKLLNLFLDEIEKKNYEIETIETTNMKIKHCIGCHSCEKDGNCIYNDLDEIYNKIELADIVIIASPIYFASFTTPLKILIDRLQVMYSRKFVLKRKIKDKKGVFIFTAGRKSKKMVEAVLLQCKYVLLSMGANFFDYACQLDTDYINIIQEENILKINEIAKKL